MRTPGLGLELSLETDDGILDDIKVALDRVLAVQGQRFVDQQILIRRAGMGLLAVGQREDDLHRAMASRATIGAHGVEPLQLDGADITCRA